MSITTVGSHLIHYEVLGRGEPLIFVHGWLGSWRYWWPSMQALSRQNRAFALDLWGFGDSSKAVNKYSFDAYVEMIDEFIERLGIMRPVTLVGHALGAAVAVRYAVHHPERVKRVIGVALPVEGSSIHTQLTNSDSQSFFNRVMKTNAYPEVEKETRKTDTVAMNNLASELTNYNFINDINACQCPTLFIFNNNDSVIQKPQINLPEESEHQHIVSLDGDHFPMLEQKATFNRLILDFIQGSDKVAPKEHWQRRTR